MMRFVKSRPSEFLVVGRAGKLRNVGAGGSAWLGPGASSVCVPTGKEEATFSMVQETADGIPLQFKGSAVYRVVDPVAAALAFDFEGGEGPERLRRLIAGVCLGELRDVVSHMTMQACIEQRKTTLTQAVATALAAVLAGAEGEASTAWGIALDVVLVAQVYVLDEELRARLEAEQRAEISIRSRSAEVGRDEEIRRTELESARRLDRESLDRARESSEISRQKDELRRALELEAQAAEARAREAALQHEVDLDRRRAEAQAQAEAEALERREALALRAQEAETARRREKLEWEKEMAELALEVGRQKLELQRLQVEKDTLRPRADADIEKDLLPERQMPQIAEALSGIYNGATLSIYGAQDKVSDSLLPLFDHVVSRIQDRDRGGRDAS